MIFNKLTNDLNLVVEHFLGEAWIGAEEDGGIHDGVSPGECGSDAGVVNFWKGCAVGTNQADGLGAVFAHLHEDGLPKEIAAEEHAVADLFFIQVVRQRTMGEGSGGFDADHETEPRAVGAAASGVPFISRASSVERRGLIPCCGVGGQAEFEDIFQVGKARAEYFPVAFSGFDEGREFFELLPTYGGLRVERLEVVAEVAVNVFVVVALGQLAELPAEAFAAGVVLAGGAPAVAAPVAEALGVCFERRVLDDIHRAPLAHREMVRWVERLGGDVAPDACWRGKESRVEGRGSRGISLKADERVGAGFGDFEEVVESEFARQLDGHGVGAAEGVAVVLDEPEIMLAAELEDGGDREGIAQGVGDHDGLGFAGRVCGLQLLGADVSCGGVVIDEDRDGSGLDDRRNGGRKPCGDRDHLIAGLDAFVRWQLVGGECGEGNKIGRGAGIDEQRVPHAEQRCEFFLEGLALRAEREPEIQRG